MNNSGPGGQPGKALPSVAVIGAGLAGLNCATRLGKMGFEVSLYEAATRVGGRVRTLRGALGAGVVTEMGGEFIDSGHTEVLSLAKEFGLGLVDTWAAIDPSLRPCYFFRGALRTDDDLASEFALLAAEIRPDVDALSARIDAFEHSENDRRLDGLSLTEYLDGIGARGWFRELIEVAYVTEMGMDAAEQSCLNFLSLFEVDADQDFRLFGKSDERFKLAGGMDQLATCLRDDFLGPIELDHRLVRIEQDQPGYRLHFDTSAGSRTYTADLVVVATPFTALRAVELPSALPEWKRRAIDDLAYGRNEKVVVGLQEPVWRSAGYSGAWFGDLACQSGWDSNVLQRGGAAYAFFLGGREAIRCSRRPVEESADEYVRQVDRAWTGFVSARTGAVVVTDWGADPLFRGSYSSYRTGQWTSLAGLARVPVGRMYFAGEHCSANHQGYMNGALESGREVAEAIIDAYLYG